MWQEGLSCPCCCVPSRDSQLVSLYTPTPLQSSPEPTSPVVPSQTSLRQPPVCLFAVAPVCFPPSLDTGEKRGSEGTSRRSNVGGRRGGKRGLARGEAKGGALLPPLSSARSSSAPADLRFLPAGLSVIRPSSRGEKIRVGQRASTHHDCRLGTVVVIFEGGLGWGGCLGKLGVLRLQVLPGSLFRHAASVGSDEQHGERQGSPRENVGERTKWRIRPRNNRGTPAEVRESQCVPQRCTYTDTHTATCPRVTWLCEKGICSAGIRARAFIITP